MPIRKTHTYYVVKLKHENAYFENAEENWYEDINYTFTDDLSKAKRFTKSLIDCEYGAPKYLYDYEKEKHIDSIKDMCEFFNAVVVEVQEETTWREIKTII